MLRTHGVPKAPASTSQNNGPVFLIGTGRCGSTYVQSLISDNSDIWMWGEHDAILTGLFNWGDSIRNSKALNNFSFQYQHVPAQERGHVNPTIAAWSNPFNAEDVEAIERDAVERLFNKGLPSGYQRWGFKEIRYGPNTRFIENMVRLFPDCRIVYLVRDPIKTADSSVRAWRRAEIAAFSTDPHGHDKIRAVFQSYLTRWQEVTRYFLDLRPQYANNIGIFRLEDVVQDHAELFQFLGTVAKPRSSKKLRAKSKNEVVFSAAEEQAYTMLQSAFTEIERPPTATEVGY